MTFRPKKPLSPIKPKSSMPKKDEETSDTYDRIAMTFGNYGKKTG